MEPLAAGDPVRVSDFALRGRLGAGGMGEVFLGWSPGGKAVAVKVVHPHLARQAEFRRRFRQEVAAARAVSGAFTAPVVASGPEDDPPWIATLYVPGPSLAEAVAKVGALPEGSVWPLAAGLVEALRAIHAEGLLHRDLKPSNVLLAADGARVIDFGIARAMDTTALTGTGTTIGTPGFMSPEQAEGDQVSSASDVFSLGAVLAFAATGGEPFGQGPPLAVLHRVVNGEPRLDGLHGPVRSLITSCLAKNPADRPTTGQLLDRITSHWQPPADFPDTPPWPQAVTALTDAHATPATALYTVHDATQPSHHSAPTLTAPPQGAQTHPAQRPPETGPDPRPTREPQPDTLAARFRHAQQLGQAGEHAQAAQLFAEVAADRARVLGADHPDTLDARFNHAWQLGDKGDNAQAVRLFAELIADRARVLGADHPDTLRTRHLHAYVLGNAGEPTEAARLFAELVADRTRVLGADHPDTLGARSLHASNLGATGKHAEAARLLAEVLADRLRVLGADHPDTQGTRAPHAWQLACAGQYAEAVRLFAELIAYRARVLGADHPDTLKARYQHAYVLGNAGEPAEAARLFAELVADRTRVLGADHPDTLSTRSLHASNLGATGKLRQSARLLAKVRADRVRVLGPDHPDTKGTPTQ
ncbi:serine/threonine-protein kinase [Wenjunlia vitaminophila]|uniref:serine/threonine-protein kinase n=1 Tax=Wenjunlia vitaminophila TaxID=76728 RepID=UPI00036B266E|nr:serine/threonine-protein kinase [Wenjunlia vitaminophila]